MNQNDGYLETVLAVDGSIPGEVVRAPTREALDAGADMLVTIPILGYVAADKDGGGDVNQSPNYLGTRFHQTIAAKGAPFRCHAGSRRQQGLPGRVRRLAQGQVPRRQTPA